MQQKARRYNLTVNPHPYAFMDYQVCVLVSTYANHGLRLTALLTSLLSAGYPNLDIILLDTDVRVNSTAWLYSTAEAVNGLGDLQTQRPRVHVSKRTQRDTVKQFPKVVGPDFG
jgi:hypothetical protein